MSLFGNLFRTKERESLSSEALRELGFHEDILLRIKEVAGTRVQSLQNYPEVTIGLSITCKPEEAEMIVEQLRGAIQHLGYLPFIAETDVGRRKNSIIGIVQTESQFDLLKLLDTNGENYDVSNEDVIGKLTEWHKRFPFTIVGANFDWVDLAFIKVPTGIELAELAKEITEFCPDAVEGEGAEEEIQELITDLKETKRLFLWWD